MGVWMYNRMVLGVKKMAKFGMRENHFGGERGICLGDLILFTT